MTNPGPVNFLDTGRKLNVFYTFNLYFVSRGNLEQVSCTFVFVHLLLTLNMFLLSELLMLLVVKPLQPGVAFLYAPPPQKKKKTQMFSEGVEMQHRAVMG